MGTAYIPTTITAEANGIYLFETEAVAEVEYTIEDNSLLGWWITNFKFEDHKQRWDSRTGTYKRTKVAEAWCPKILVPTLKEYADQTAIEEALSEHLYSTGELAYENGGLRADYHARVL